MRQRHDCRELRRQEMKLRNETTMLLVSIVIGLAYGAAVKAEGDPAGHVVTPPDKLIWKDLPLPGAKQAVLYGDPKKAGPYTMRVKFPPNTKNPPHTHPDNRQATVISGTWYFGHGDTLDEGKSTILPTGTFFTEPAKTVHYNFTKSDEVVIQISGMGPTATDYVKK